MAVIGWVVLGLLIFLFMFGAPFAMNQFSFYGYLEVLGPWLLCWVVAIVITALIVFGLAAVTGALG